jgi:peptidoglycan/LPS O-acetylase OafA/YrhL
LGFGLVAVLLWRYHLVHHCVEPAAYCLADGDERRILHATDTRLDSILYGALLATLLGTRLAPSLLGLLGSQGALVAGLLLIGASVGIRDPSFRDIGRFSVQGVGLFLAVGNILFANRSGWLRRLLSRAPGLAIGRWSYSLYLWHWLVLIAALGLLPADMREAAHQGGLPLEEWAAFSVPVLAVSLALAAASHHFIERPILNLRRRFGSHRSEPGDQPGAIGEIG